MSHLDLTLERGIYSCIELNTVNLTTPDRQKFLVCDGTGLYGYLKSFSGIRKKDVVCRFQWNR